MSFFDFGFDDNSACTKKVSSFFGDTEEITKREKRQGPNSEDDGEDHSEVEMKVLKKTKVHKVDTSLVSVLLTLSSPTSQTRTLTTTLKVSKSMVTQVTVA